jgi:Kef-type K+ transport system membrane component KefB
MVLPLFALVGARFQIALLPTMGLLGVVYVVLRSFGKFTGAWLGGTLGGAGPAVRNNLGLGLLSQAGVAIGLALASASWFSAYGEEGRALGHLIINVITATTFVVQIIGPICVKIAISQPRRRNRAGHRGTRRLGLRRSTRIGFHLGGVLFVLPIRSRLCSLQNGL